MTSLLARVDRFDLPAPNGRTYEISISRPAAPRGGGEPSDCPIVFVPDAIIAFGTTAEVAAYGGTLAGQTPAVVVGIGYGGEVVDMVQTRTLDLTPQPDPDLPPLMAGMIGTGQGGADAFLDFIVGPLTEEVCRRAPEASPSRRILFGHSLGGLLTVHALMTRPGDFEAFCASAPSLWWADFAVLKLRDGLDARLAAAGARPKVFISVGGLEQTPMTAAPPGWDLGELNAQLAKCRMVDAAADLARSLTSAPLKAVQHVVFDNETHVSTLPAAISRALRFALTPEAA